MPVSFLRFGLLFLLLAPLVGAFGMSDRKTITLEKIMSDPIWMGRSAEASAWSIDGKAIVYWQKQATGPLYDFYCIDTEKALMAQVKATVIPEPSHYLYAYQDKATDPQREQLIWIFENNLFLKQGGQTRQLTRDNQARRNPGFLNNGHPFWEQDDGFYRYDLAQGSIEMISSWRFGEKKTAVEEPGDFLAREQIKLSTTLSNKRLEAKIISDHDEAYHLINGTYAPAPFYLPEDQRLVQSALSPNGRWMILVTAEQEKPRDQDFIPGYVTETGRITNLDVRARVADAQPVSHQLWLADIESHELVELGFENLPGYDEDVLKKVKTENALAKGEKYQSEKAPRAIRLMEDWDWRGSPVQWQPQGKSVAIMLKAWDNKDRWLVTVNIDTRTLQKSALETQHRLHDDAWINYNFNQFGWFHTQNKLYYLSEQSGYSHLYTQEPGKKPVQLTRGKFEVDHLKLTSDDNRFFFTANKPHPGEYEVYSLSSEGRDLVQLTDTGGMTEFELSPAEDSLLLRSSTATRPPELFLLPLASPLKESGTSIQLTHTVSEEFNSYSWPTPSFVTIDASAVDGSKQPGDSKKAAASKPAGQPVYARLYLPEAGAKTGTNERGKAVFFIHGAGYLQNSHKGWSEYFREYMFNAMLQQRGYAVIDIDYRASKGYGRDWRTAIYRDMGTPELADLKATADYLVREHAVDPDRIGAYGGSYGGFLVLTAMFRAPELFAAGAALRTVTDWAHYNTGYTANILNTPDVDPIAYRRSSPIYFAEGLQHPLLINAPMVDTNVLFQDTVRLVQRLIELEKQDFETAIYPVESHGFTEPSSWLDEYRRIYKLMEENL